MPAIRTQELLYSAIARGRRYLQAPGAGPFMRELLGRRWAVASVDLPGGLDDLACDLPAEDQGDAVDSWIDGATLMPFHTAFAPAEIRAEARSAMRGEVAGLYVRLGLAAFRVRPPDRLRFCPACLDDMEQSAGDLWWRRDHQMPGVPVCPVHGSILRLSDVTPGGERHSFVAATRAVCRAEAPLALEGASDADIESLADLAGRAAALLDAPPPARSYGKIMTDHRDRMAAVGLMRSRRKVDHAALHAAFADRWGGVTRLIPGLELVENEKSWLTQLVRNDRRAAHPLQHVLLEAVLERLADVPVARPFGAGPWPCRNPLAHHHGLEAITDVTVRRDRGTLYGDFACSCGYIYTRACHADGTVGEPRYRRFGPMLVPALQAAVACGDGLRPTARALGLDPKTLMREAAMAGVAVPWTTGASGGVPIPKMSVTAPPRRHRRPHRRRALRNWFAIDVRLARATRRAVAEIVAAEPPCRATFAEIERRVAKRDWLRKRAAKLPQTITAVEAALEATDAFRGRRLTWCVSRALDDRDLSACDVLRAAGLPMEWLEEVRMAVAEASLPRAQAA
ncbi:TnsD family Tn7-like transposition protein [Sphingomonas palmae]|uniref:TnsD family Tn7-like transposition protein n=1 Tax=Sphingomonas palmae TaxID=1855283 RepID=UPI0015A682DA|nr:TnsD family Tn7-like transposition protein [Sphingomonas palmae]